MDRPHGYSDDVMPSDRVQASDHFPGLKVIHQRRNSLEGSPRHAIPSINIQGIHPRTTSDTSEPRASLSNPTFRKSFTDLIQFQFPSTWIFRQHLVHRPQSVQSTPRLPTPRPGGISPRDGMYEGIPGALLASEGSSLDASFSHAPSRVEGMIPIITAMDVAADGSVLVGDALGRVEHLDERGDRLSVRQSHQAFVAEFDCLKSKHVGERVACAKYLKPARSGTTTCYLAMNEYFIKVFRVREGASASMAPRGPFKTTTSSSASGSPLTGRKAILPVKVFQGPHQFEMNGLSLSADQETFLSYDDFRVFWWALEAEDTKKATSLFDITPPNIEDVDQVVTSCAFHSYHGSLFLVATSRGCNIGDLRHPPSRAVRTFQNFQILPEYNCVQCPDRDDILTTISDAAFLGDHHIVTRDYLSLKLWDLRKATAPVMTSAVMGYVVDYLEELYNNDEIFHRFRLDVDHETSSVLTGLYGGRVAYWCPNKGEDCVEFYKADADVPVSETPNGGRCDRNEIDNEASKNGIDDDDRRNKVTNIAMAPGARTFCFSTNDHLFSFDNKKLVSRRLTSPPPASRYSSQSTSPESED